MQLLSLYKLHRQSKPVQLHQHFIRAISGDVNPFSFWRSIYVNPENHRPEELKAILAHEQVHVSEWHTIDILLGEISSIFYWFNPGVWLMKRAIRENIEFITDQKILQSGSDPKAYQYSLLNVSFSGGHNAIVNHFNTSTIKKRIMMMNAKRSSPLNVTRYALLVPAVVALVLVFSVSKAEFKKQITKSNTAIAEAFTTVIEKIEPVTTNIAVAAKRSVDLLPDAVHVLFTDSVKKQTPVKYNYNLAYDTTGRGVYRLQASKDTPALNFNITWIPDSSRYSDTSKKPKEIVVTGYRIPNNRNSKSYSINGDVISPDGNIYFNGEPVKKAMVNGVIISSPHKMTAEEMELLKKAGTATIYPGGVIDISQEKITKVKVNGVEMTSSVPVGLNYINTQNVKKISVDKDGVVNVDGNVLNNNSGGVKTVQGFSYNPNVINIKRPVDTTNKPLIVVNGNVANTGLLNQNDIESMTVLKSARATSLYGEKAKNGAILITTKAITAESFMDLGTGKTLTTRPGFEKMYDSNGGVYYHSPDKPIRVTNTPRRAMGLSSTNPLKTTSSPNKASNGIVVTGYGTSPNIFAGNLLIVDGKEMSQRDFSKIPADKIEVVKKGGAKELKKYGSKAKNGVLIITTNR